LIVGGRTASGVYVSTTEKLSIGSGDYWTTTSSLNTGRFGVGGCGSQSATLTFGGQTGAQHIANSEKFLGIV